MIYSTNYAELYRRVMQGEEVLCIANPGSDVPCFAKKMAEYAIVSLPAGQMIVCKDGAFFDFQCQRLNLRFVPDNEGLVKIAKEVMKKWDIMPIDFDCDLTELQTILKQYEHD